MRAWHTSALLMLLAACGRIASPPDELRASGGSGGSNVAGANSVGGSTTAMQPLDCEPPHPGPKPLSRLTGAELTESMRQLLPGLELTTSLPAYFDAEPEVSVLLLSEIHRLAHDAALGVTRDSKLLRAALDCDPEAATCRDHFIERFATRAFRRPATPTEQEELAGVFETGRELQGDFAGGARAVLEVGLQSPEFLYLLELGDGRETGGFVHLTAHETAARLAYFLTGAPPDDALAAAADEGALNEAGIEEQTRRLLGSPANRQQVQALYQKVYGLLPNDQGEISGVPSDFARLALTESASFIEHVTFEGAGTFRDLLTQPTTWVNEPLARFYGYAGVTGEQLTEVALDPTQRGGLFTQAAFLSSTSSITSTHPIQRGTRVLSSLLCQDLQLPPADADFSGPDADPVTGTMRQRITRFTSGPKCQSCHRDINPVGFAFEHYDGPGRYRELDEQLPIDASGELYITDARGPFDDAIGLLKRLAESDDAKACFVHHWLEHAYRRAEEPADACSSAELQQAFAGADGNVVQLMAALARSDNFRFRQKGELAAED